jgi:Ca-activated chloride channel homolog
MNAACVTSFALWSTVAAAPAPAVNVCVAIDRSASMAGDNIVVARLTALAILRRLGADDGASVVAYGDVVEMVGPAGRATRVAGMEERLRALRPRGGSTLFAGVVMCSNELAKPAARRGARRIIVISDGKATLGPTAASELGLLGAYLHEQGLSVATIGVGFGYNKELMSELGRQGGGGPWGRSDGTRR